MTFDEYILNPMGKNNAVLNSVARENIRKDYTHRFDNLLLRENGKIEYYLYQDSKNNAYYVHIKVPSETVKDFYYDVVIKFTRSSDLPVLHENNLFKYQAQFYSNDPAFVYTYAHVFMKNNLFIRELRSKMSKEAIKKSPTEKNPGNNVGYVKTIYFAYLIMENRKLNTMIKFKAESKPLVPADLLNSIMDADDKIEKRQEEGKKYSHRKKIEVDQNTLKNLKKQAGDDANFSGLQVRTTKKINTISRSKTSKFSKNSTSIKTTPRVKKK